MSTYFNFNRFALLIKKQWAENRKRYTLSLLALIGLLVAWFLLNMLIAENMQLATDLQQLTFFFSLFFLGAIVANDQYRDLGNKAKANNFLLLPASSLEKYLCSLLYALLLYGIVFTLAFYIADGAMIMISNAFAGATGATVNTGLINIFDFLIYRFNERIQFNLILIFLCTQSVFLLGAVYFKKLSFVKTIITSFVIFVIVFFLGALIYRQLPGEPQLQGEAQIPAWVSPGFGYLMYILAPVLWISTYKRLKSTQL